MKTVILCGGLGTRLAEETIVRPKPMVDIGGMPILWHIMKIYSHYNFNEFFLTLGYKGEYIKDYFLNYHPRMSDITVNLRNGHAQYANPETEDWVLHMIDTGKDTLTGGRLKRLESRLKNQGTFMLTYGDGVADISIDELVAFHRSHGKLATVTAVRPPARFGAMNFDGNKVMSFQEKPQTGEGWINGGFFVFEPGVFKYLKDDATILERDPLENLAKDGQLMAYKHEGFWQPMDTIRDRELLEKLCRENIAPWKVWVSEKEILNV